MITVLDLLEPHVRKLISAQVDLGVDNEALRIAIQVNLPMQSKHIIDQIHFLFCRAAECEYHIEDNMEDTWLLSHHVEWTDIAVALLNEIDVTPKYWRESILPKYLEILNITKADKKLFAFIGITMDRDKSLATIVSRLPKPLQPPST